MTSSDKRHLQSLLDAQHHDPFQFLGVHQTNNGDVLRVFHPRANNIYLKSGQKWLALTQIAHQPLFELNSKDAIPTPCLLKIEVNQHTFEIVDPYTFKNTISQDDLYLFGEGTLKQAYKMLGAHSLIQEGVAGVRFSVWAPNA